METEKKQKRTFDTFTPEERSQLMARIHGKDTKPELVVRRLTHSMGYRYRLHVRKLPGTPDMVFPRRRKVVFVHGCYWHMHEGCPNYRPPRSRVEFWQPKLVENRRRDAANQARLHEMGWSVLVVWDCELKDKDALAARLRAFLED